MMSNILLLQEMAHFSQSAYLSGAFTFEIDGIAADIIITDRRQIIAFRGTASQCDWDVNADRTLFPLMSDSDALVHAGYQKAYVTWHNSMSDHLYHRMRTVVTGHSMGGALAAIALVDLRHRGFQVEGVTFGAPRVGDGRFAALLSGLTRVVLRNDLVPHLPALLRGYRHGGDLVYLDTDDRIHVSPSPWYVARDIVKAKLRGLRQPGLSMFVSHRIDEYVETLDAQ